VGVRVVVVGVEACECVLCVVCIVLKGGKRIWIGGRVGL